MKDARHSVIRELLSAILTALLLACGLYIIIFWLDQILKEVTQ